MPRSLQIMIFSGLFACQSAEVPAPDAPARQVVRVLATTPAMGWLARQVAGDLAHVEILLPDDARSPTWKPDPSQIEAFRTADFVVKNGAGYEPWLDAAGLPPDHVIDTTLGLDLSTDSRSDPPTQNPAVWLDPLFFLAQGQAIHRNLLREHPDWSEALDAHLGVLRTLLLETHEHAKTELASLEGHAFPGQSEPFAYLAKRYAFTIEPVDPAPASLADLGTSLAAWSLAHPDARVWIADASSAQAEAPALPEGWRRIDLDDLVAPIGGVYDWPARFSANLAKLKQVEAPPEPSNP